MVVTKIAITNIVKIKKNQEKANNSPSYRCAAIIKIVKISYKFAEAFKPLPKPA